jgi:hypothetical protein
MPGLRSSRGIPVPPMPHHPASLSAGASAVGRHLGVCGMELRGSCPCPRPCPQASRYAPGRHPSPAGNGGGLPAGRSLGGRRRMGTWTAPGYRSSGFRPRRALGPRPGPGAWIAPTAIAAAPTGGQRSNPVVCCGSSSQRSGRLLRHRGSVRGDPCRRSHHHRSYRCGLRCRLEGCRLPASCTGGAVSSLVPPVDWSIKPGQEPLSRHNCLVLLGGSGSRLPTAAQSFLRGP